MTQEAVVTKILPNGMAEVAVERGTACGGNCGSCESCVYQSEIRTTAVNSISAVPGQKVVIETMSSKIYKAIILVYIAPIVLLLLGYAVAALAGLGEGMCILVSFLFFLAGVAWIVLSERKRRRGSQIKFEIIQLR